MARESTSSIQWNQGSFVYLNSHLLLIPPNVLFLTLTFFLFSPAFLSSSLSFPPFVPSNFSSGGGCEGCSKTSPVAAGGSTVLSTRKTKS